MRIAFALLLMVVLGSCEGPGTTPATLAERLARAGAPDERVRLLLATAEPLWTHRPDSATALLDRADAEPRSALDPATVRTLITARMRWASRTKDTTAVTYGLGLLQEVGEADPLIRSAAERMLAQAYGTRGFFREADSLLVLAIADAERIGDSTAIAGGRGDRRQALEHYERAGSIDEALGLQENNPYVLDRKRRMLKDPGRLPEALTTGRFDFTVEVDPALDTARVSVPPLVVKPLLENAIEHGVGPLEGGGRITLGAGLRDGSLVLSAEDNGVGRQAPPVADRRPREELAEHGHHPRAAAVAARTHGPQGRAAHHRPAAGHVGLGAASGVNTGGASETAAFQMTW